MVFCRVFCKCEENIFERRYDCHDRYLPAGEASGWRRSSTCSPVRCWERSESRERHSRSTTCDNHSLVAAPRADLLRTHHVRTPKASSGPECSLFGVYNVKQTSGACRDGCIVTAFRQVPPFLPPRRACETYERMSGSTKRVAIFWDFGVCTSSTSKLSTESLACRELPTVVLSDRSLDGGQYSTHRTAIRNCRQI